MKRNILAILLVFMLVLPIAGCGAKETPDASGDASENPAAAVSQEKSEPELLSRAFMETMKSGKYYMNYSLIMKLDGNDAKMDIIGAVDGKDTDTMMDMGGLKIHALLKGGNYYMIDDTSKTYMKMEVPQDNSDGQLPSMADAVYQGSGTDTVDGKTLPYEEYKVEGGTARYYMDGKNLYAMSANVEGVEMVLIVKEISETIPAGMLELPGGYTETPSIQ